jgi:hypothetical protein
MKTATMPAHSRKAQALLHEYLNHDSFESRPIGWAMVMLVRAYDVFFHVVCSQKGRDRTFLEGSQWKMFYAHPCK